MFSNLFELGLFVFLCWCLLYMVVDRICKCREHCATAEAFSKMGLAVDKDFLKKIGVIKRE